MKKRKEKERTCYSPINNKTFINIINKLLHTYTYNKYHENERIPLQKVSTDVIIVSIIKLPPSDQDLL